eukprot:1295023-Pyramimonas_sp.AAC.1
MSSWAQNMTTEAMNTRYASRDSSEPTPSLPQSFALSENVANAFLERERYPYPYLDRVARGRGGGSSQLTAAAQV